MLSFPSSPTTGQEHTTGGRVWVFTGSVWAPKKETLDFAEAIHAAPAKPSPADADELGYVDSAAGWGLKKLTWANIKTALASLFVSKSGDTVAGNLEFSPSYTTVHGGGVLLGPRYLSGTVTPTATSWYRLCTIPGSNQGQALEFYFVLPVRHVVLKVSFGKTTRGGNYGAGILEVELLGSFEYGYAHPYDWRVVDDGTNGSTHIDIRFNSSNGSPVNYQVHLLHTIRNNVDISFPLSSLGSASGTGVTNYGFSMGSGGGNDWTTQKFKLNASIGAYVAESNNFTRTTGTAIGM